MVSQALKHAPGGDLNGRVLTPHGVAETLPMVRLQGLFFVYLAQAFFTNVDFQVVRAFGNLVERELLLAGAEFTLSATSGDGI